MKKSILRSLCVIVVFLSCMSESLLAQNRGLSNYLEGAVPVEDGSVVFKETFTVSGISKDSLVSITSDWINERNNEEENRSGRVLILNKEEGDIVGGFTEKLVFKSALLMLDQADISYYFHAICKDGQVDLEVIRIRYAYGDDERYTAEELITDEVSLSKDRKKILRSSEKWRVKTIDFMDQLFNDYKYYLFQRVGK